MSLTDLIKSVASVTVPSVPPPAHDTEPLEPASQAPVPPVPSVPPEYSEEPEVTPNWLDWIDEHCLLLPEDRAHVAFGLYRLHPRLQQRLAERYVEAWHAAAADEPKYHKRDNAGRHAANIIITHLRKGNGHI